MPFNYPRSGLNNVAEYQSSGLPWVTSSLVTTGSWKIEFPYVTNYLSLHAVSGSVRLGFTENGVNGSNYLLLTAGTDPFITVPVRCSTIYLRADTGTASASLFAGLTTIDERSFPILTGSAIYNSSSIVFELGYGISGSPGAGTGLG